MKSKLVFALFLVALLPVVSGSQEVVEMGPYDVSFYIDTTESYDVNTDDPVEFSRFTDWPLGISGSGFFISAEILDHYSSIKIDEEVLKSYMVEQGFLYPTFYETVTYQYGEIGEKNEVLAVATDDNNEILYVFAYSPDVSEDYGRTVVLTQCSGPVCDQFLTSLDITRR